MNAPVQPRLFIHLEEQIREVEREIKRRKRYFPQLVKRKEQGLSRGISQQECDFRIAAMEGALDTLKDAQKQHQKDRSLF